MRRVGLAIATFLAAWAVAGIVLLTVRPVPFYIQFLVGIGLPFLALGALGGFGLSRALNAMFWRMTSADPVVFSVIGALMLAAALGAAWVPVHRVTRIDPQQALRYE